jgi:iron complex outermembrane recepter protein
MSRQLVAKLSAIAVACSISLSAHAIAEAHGKLDVPAGELIYALKSLATQLDIELVYQPGQLRNIRTDGLRGTYSAQQAITMLLKGTPFRVHTDSSGAMVIALPATGGPPAAVQGDSTRGTATPPPTGGYEAGEPESSMLEEVIVTGSRFANRTSLSSPVPVDTVSAADLRAGGRTELAESLAATVPALNFTAVSTAGTASATRPFTYRGLPPNEVLVLVNGKRWHPTAPKGLGGGVTFDFNSIPSTAVSSVEVLRDGAAAQYGSDAIAGVINIRLRNDVRTELTASTGQYYEGDGLTVETGLDTGLLLGSEGFLHLSTYYRDSSSTNRQGRDKRQQYFAFNASGNPVVLGVVNNQTDLTPVLPAGFSFDPRELAGVDRDNTFREGNAERREAGLSFNSELPVSGSMTLYGFGGYTHRTVETVFTWRRPLDNTNVRAIFPEGYAPIFDARVADVQLAAGLKGQLAGWEWDLSESWGFNRLASYAENTVNVSFGAASPTRFFSGVQRIDQATTNLDLRRELDVGLPSPLRVAFGSEYRREGFEVRAGEPASYANGGVPVLDGPSAGTAAPIGAQGIVGYAPSDAVDVSRNSIAGYVDLENQLTSNLLVTLAGRYENYSDFGSTTNGKLSFRQELASFLALRGSVSTGFRAPNLYESYFSNTGSQISGGQFLIQRHFPVADPVALALGAQPLEPEESRNYALGLVMTVKDRFAFTADVYRIFVDETIIQSSNFNDLATRNFLASRGFVGISAATFFTNAVDKRVDGIDITASYTASLVDGSRLTLSGAANFNDPQVLSVDPTPAALSAVTPIPLFNQRAIVAVEQGAPRSRINATVNYSRGAMQFLVRGTRYGSTRDLGANPVLTDQVYDAKWVTDLEMSYDVNNALRLTAGAQNLFDVFPEQNTPANNPGGFLNYPVNFGNAPFGVNGGQYYLRALLRFR